MADRNETLYKTLYEIPVTDIKGQETTLGDYQGKVLLIVNTASKCGFTPQFEGLQSMYAQYQARGLVVLGFPCNQFMHQDPASNDEIMQFCSLNYQVDFPMFAKLEVNGANTHPLYAYLKSHAKGLLGSESIKWNFTKFLVNREGQVVERYPPTAKPEDIEKDMVKLL